MWEGEGNHAALAEIGKATPFMRSASTASGGDRSCFAVGWTDEFAPYPEVLGVELLFLPHSKDKDDMMMLFQKIPGTVSM